MTTLKEYAAKMVSNWKAFDSFIWSDKPDDAESRCLVYTCNRSSGLSEQSNAACIAHTLAPFSSSVNGNGSVTVEHHTHWAVGWVEGYSILVHDSNGDITPAFEVWYSIIEQLKEYPLLDDADYAIRGYEAALEGIMDSALWKCRIHLDGLPENWPVRVYNWLSENAPDELDDRDDRGAYPDQEWILKALQAEGLVT